MQELFKKHRTYTLLLGFLFIYMIYSRIRLIFSYSIDLDGVEFMFIHYAQNILYQKGMYCDVNKFPFDTVIHMPYYTYFIAAIFKTLHLTTVNDIHLQLIVCRIISICCLPVCILYLTKIIRLFNIDLLLTISAICFFMLYLTGHFYSARQDSVKTTFFLMYLYYTLLYLKKDGPQNSLLFSTLSLIIAINAKQDIIVYISVFIVIILLLHEFKKSVVLLLIFAATIFFTFIIGYAISGTKFIDNTVLLNFQVNDSNLKSYNLLALLFSLIRTLPVLIFLAYLHLKNKTDLKSRTDLLTLIYLSYLTYFMSHLLIFRASSYINYTHESLAVILITIVAMGKYFNPSARFIRYTSATILFVCLSGFIIHAYPISNKNEKECKSKYFQNIQNKAIIDTIIKNHPTHFITCDNAIYYPEKQLVFGYDYHIDRFIYAYLGFSTKSKLLFLNSKTYDEYFQQGNVKYIVANDNKRDKEIMHEYYPVYSIYKNVNNLIVYKLP